MHKLNSELIHKTIFYISMLFVFLFFYRISSLTPLAGDDWGYAINGVQGHPLKMAIDFYFTWSGRFFSELYGFLVTPNKSFWNILNPFLFTTIFYFSLKISKLDKSYAGIALMIFLMLSVKDELRMETYTWLMGTTYVIPLALSLCFIYQMIQVLQKNKELKTIQVILNLLLLFYIGLTMENIALVMILANLCIILYSYLKYRKIPFFMYQFLFISILSFVILRLSPGANARLIRDHQLWLNFSIFEQIIINYPNFIRFTFIENRYLVLIFSGLNILVLIKQYFINYKFSFFNILMLIIFSFACVISISLTLSQYTDNSFLIELTQPQSLINMIFWPIYIVMIFINVLNLPKFNRDLVIYFVLLAGLSNGVMMASPIFGFRSSIYTVYFMMVASLIIFETLNIKYLDWLILIPLIVMILRSTNGLLQKYNLVATVNNIRTAEINYYKNNPLVNEAWLIRYPIYSIHAGDIEQDDPYHMEVFKDYYGLQQDTILKFYYPEFGYDNLYQ